MWTFLFSTLLYAAPTPEIQLEEALKRELGYINLQIQSLQKQQQAQKTARDQKTAGLQREIKRMTQESAGLAVQIDETQAQVTQLERQRKSLFDKSMNLTELYNKAMETLLRTETELKFKFWNPSQDFKPATGVEFEQLWGVLRKSTDVLEQASRLEKVKASFLDQKGVITQGEILRVGRVAAVGEGWLMGPSTKGVLQALEPVMKDAETLSVYLFNELTSHVDLKVKATLWDRLADWLPGIVLVFVFGLVLILFSLFARE